MYAFLSRESTQQDPPVLTPPTISKINTPTQSIPISLPDWMVFFSPSGVKVVNKYLLNSVHSWSKVKKASIGPTTARAMRSLGWTVDAIADKPTPKNLLKCILNYYQ